jgi:CBS domain-containing protein
VAGKYDVDTEQEGEQLRGFTNRVLRDLRALELMLERGMFETGIRRIGAEQEVFLVDRNWRPAPTVLRLLEKLQDPHYVTEVAQFNLEMNLDAQTFEGPCLRKLEEQLLHLLLRARSAAQEIGNEVVLTGILPTVRKSDLGLDNMTPIPRYAAINRAMTKLKGSDYEIRLKGVDEVLFRHDSVMAEACNTSFQVHFQVAPEEFARYYNLAQVLAAPVLAAATNSMLLFGKRLWHETRIALFQQSVDTRSASEGLRETSPRVDFGRQWVRKSVVELFQEAIARYRVLIATEGDEDPVAKVERGEAPELKALRLHNGTIYRWNRACYGISPNGKPHLRIEMRVLPSGPTPLDEVANAAFWYGLMLGMGRRIDDVTKHMSFDDAKGNFFAAARGGIASELMWLDGKQVVARDLVLEQLLPLAHEGLESANIDASDVERYLGTIRERCISTQTGSRWQLKSFNALAGKGTDGERINAVTAATVARQWENVPVARWEPARLEEGGGWKNNYVKVEQFMTTDFATVQEGDGIDLAANLMVWERIRHVPVEDAKHRLVGLVSYRALLRALTQAISDGKEVANIPVGDVMKRDPVCVSPDTPTLKAIELLRRGDFGTLPVVDGEGRLVGMVMARNFMGIAAELLEEKLQD